MGRLRESRSRTVGVKESKRVREQSPPRQEEYGLGFVDHLIARPPTKEKGLVMTTVPWVREEVKGASLSRLRATQPLRPPRFTISRRSIGKAPAWSRDQRRITNQVTHRRSRHRAMPSCKTPIKRLPSWFCGVHWQGDPLAHLNQFRQLGQASSSSLRYQSEPAQPRNW